MKSMCRILVMGLALAAFAVPHVSFGFCTDSVPSQYFESAKALYGEEILRGNDQGACNLNAALNRIEFTTLILRYNYADDDIVDLAKKEKGSFPDLTPGIWYEHIAKAAKFEGLIQGAGDTGKGNFGKGINGAEAATVTLRGANIYIPQPLPGEQWYDPAINVMKAVNLRTYSPSHQMTRGEAVRMIYEVINHIDMLESAAANYDETDSSSESTVSSSQPSQPTQPPSSVQPTQPSSTASGGSFKVVSSLRYLAENFDSLNGQQTAALVKSLNETDMMTLGIYSAFASLVHAKACEADPNLIMPLATGAVNCYQTAEGWQNTLYFSNGDMQQATSYAYQNRDELLIGIKCGTGEIDAGSCNLYTGIRTQNMNRMNDIFREMLDQCVYDGQVLSNGATCVSY